MRKASHPLLRACFKKIINFCSIRVRELQHSKRIFQPLYYKYKIEKRVTLEFQVSYSPIHPEGSILSYRVMLPHFTSRARRQKICLDWVGTVMRNVNAVHQTMLMIINRSTYQRRAKNVQKKKFVVEICLIHRGLLKCFGKVNSL